MVRYFTVSPPSVHTMVKKLERCGFIAREPGKARVTRLLIPVGCSRRRSRDSAAEPRRSQTPHLEALQSHERSQRPRSVPGLSVATVGAMSAPPRQ
jgi:DNA-binding IclR family transcriptional regulator